MQTHAVLVIGLYELLGKSNYPTHWATLSEKLTYFVRMFCTFLEFCIIYPSLVFSVPVPKQGPSFPKN
jgi:hypothetical protein